MSSTGTGLPDTTGNELPLEGYNEALIVYVLAASSPLIPFRLRPTTTAGHAAASSRLLRPAFGIETQQTVETGRSLVLGTILASVWTRATWSDRYANYWNVVLQPSPSNYRYCVENPKQYKGYGGDCWGLTEKLQKAIRPCGRQRPWCHHRQQPGQFPYTGSPCIALEVFLFKATGFGASTDSDAFSGK